MSPSSPPDQTDQPDPAAGPQPAAPYPWRRLVFGVTFFVAVMSVLKLSGFPDGDRAGVPEALRFGMLAGAIFALLIASWETWRWRHRR